MAEQTVKVVIQGQDKTAPAFKSASGNVSILHKDVSGLTKVIGGGLLAAGAGLTAFLYSAAKGAGQAEASITRVTATLRAMGPAALKNKDALLEMSAAAVKLGFDDEAVAESLAKFYQRTNDLTEAQNLNNVAMDLARAKNIDLASASTLVGQVLSGNGRLLKQYGIELDETKTPLQALGELHDQVKGQAVAFSETFQGRMLVINESVSNLKDTIGSALLEAITPFIQSLATWAQNPDVQMKVKEIATVLGEFAQVTIPVIIDALKILYGWFQGITEILGTIIYTIQQAIDKIQAFVSATKNLGSKVGGSVSGTVKSLVSKVLPRASGGPVSAGSPYIVGERGPEFFVPSSNGSIIPNGGLASAGASITINVSGNTLLDDRAGEKIGQQIMKILNANLRH